MLIYCFFTDGTGSAVMQDACIMVNRLNELGVQMQGIEQPAGIFSLPNKILQAFTLTASERKATGDQSISL